MPMRITEQIIITLGLVNRPCATYFVKYLMQLFVFRIFFIIIIKRKF